MKYTSRAHGSLLIAFLFCSAGSAISETRGATYHFARIDVEGNTELTDGAILRMCDLSSEKTYTDERLEDAFQCLVQSEQFELVNFDTSNNVLLVNVQEVRRYSGLLDVGLSIDSLRGLSGNLYVEKRDLFVEGISGSLSLEVSDIDQYFSGLIVKDDLFSSGNSGGGNFEYSSQSYPNLPFESQQFELGTFINFSGDNSASRIRAGLQYSQIEVTAANSGPFMSLETDEYSRLFVSYEFEGEKEVGATIASSPTVLGYGASQTLYLNAEGGAVSRSEFNVSARTELDDGKFQLGASLDGGHLQALGDARTSIADRFTLGGSGLRGFAPQSIGPSESGYTLGGETFALMRVEGDMRVVSFENFELRGGLFVDLGSAWNLADASPNIDTSAKLRSSAGISLTVDVGNVPIDIYYAEPLVSEPGDTIQSFGFALSQNF